MNVTNYFLLHRKLYLAAFCWLLLGLCLGCDQASETANMANMPPENAERNITGLEAIEPETTDDTQITQTDDNVEESAVLTALTADSDAESTENADDDGDQKKNKQPATQSSATNSKVSDRLPIKKTPTSNDAKKRGLSMSDAFNELNDFESYVLLEKGTERAYTGEFWDSKAKGTYICRRCNAQLYKSDSKFDSHCGWPSFDDEIKGAVTRQMDADGSRTEIVCTNCGGHLGHVFIGEQYTEKNTRHCVNSVSMKFVPEGTELPERIDPSKESKKDETKKPDNELQKP